MTEIKWNFKTYNAQFESMLNCWCRENFCSICVKSIRGYGNQISGRGEHLMRRLMRIVGLYPAFQPSSDHSVAPWGGALLKSTICSSAAFRCASISRRALCHSLTQNPYTGVMSGLMVSPPHLKRKEDNICHRHLSTLSQSHLRPDFLASPIYTIQEKMKVRNVLLDHSAC